MSKVIRSITCIFLLILCSNLYGADKGPDWIYRPSKSYSEKYFFSAVGNSKDKSSAEVSAINNLSSVFGQSVKSNITSALGVSTSYVSASLDQKVVRQVNHENLIGVDIRESWFDEKNATWYVLAVMDKDKAFDIYKSIIEQNYDTISLADSYTKSQKSSTIDGFARLYKASVLCADNEVFYNRLKVINLKKSEGVYKKEYAPSVINKSLKDYAYKIPVCIDITGDESGLVHKAFSDVLALYGFNTVKGSNEKYVLKGAVELTESVGNNKSTFYCEYVVNADLKDTYAGEDLIPVSITGREGSPSKNNAKKRSISKACDKIKTSFTEQFLQFLAQFS